MRHMWEDYLCVNCIFWSKRFKFAAVGVCWRYLRRAGGRGERVVGEASARDGVGEPRTGLRCCS